MKNKIWAEKYRPETIDDYIFPTDDKLKKNVLKWADEGIFPNLILAGVQGTGKSTLAGLLVNEFGIDDTDFLRVDGSVRNKVGDVREFIIPFCDYSPMSDFKVVLIEESHRLSHDAQSALLDTIEQSSKDVRFIFTTNFPQKLLPPILSRCTTYMFSGNFDEEAAVDRIAHILSNEGYEDLLESEESVDNILAHVEAFKPDMRSIISSIQESIHDGKVGLPSNSIRSSSIEEWEQIWMAEELDVDRLMNMVYLVDNNNFEAFYTTIYEKGLHHFTDSEKAEVVVYLSDYLSKAMGASTQGIQSIHMEALLHTIFNFVGESE